MTRARLRVAATSSFRADPRPPLPRPPPPRTRPEDRPGLPTNTGLWMRAAPGTRQLVPISCGYIRRPRGWTGRRGGEAKGWGPRPARPLLSGAGFLIPTRRVRRCPGSRVGKRIPNREESGGRWKKGVARAPLTYLGAVAATAATRATGGVGARAHAPANSRSPSPGLPAAPLGFRGRRERNEKWPQQIRERRGNWAGARCPRGAAPGGGRHRARWVRTA